MPYNAGLQEHVDGVWVDPSEQKIIFTDFSGEKHEVASPDSLADGLHFSNGSIRSYTMGNGDYLITYAVRDDMQNSSDLYYRVFDTDTGSFVGQAEHLGHLSESNPTYGLYMEEPGRVVIRDFMSYLFSGEVVSDGNGTVEAEFNFNDPTNYDLVWAYDWGGISRVSVDSVPEHLSDDASAFAAIRTNLPFELAAYITESNGEWKLKAKLFNGGSEHAVESARVIANDIFVPVVADEEPPFVNIESLGDGKFGINLAKLDANGAVQQLKYTEVLIQEPEHDWQQWEYYEYNILEPYSATVNYPVMPDILICSSPQMETSF